MQYAEIKNSSKKDSDKIKQYPCHDRSNCPKGAIIFNPGYQGGEFLAGV